MSSTVSIGAPTRLQVALFISGLVAIATLSQSFRVLLNTVAPDVMRDLGMSAAVYGVAVSVFFLSLLLAQVPLGIAFDRYGVRGPIAVLTVLTVLGAIGQALARTPLEMIAARLLVGLGCSGYFMAGAVLWRRVVRAGAILDHAGARLRAGRRRHVAGRHAAGCPLGMAGLARRFRRHGGVGGRHRLPVLVHGARHTARRATTAPVDRLVHRHAARHRPHPAPPTHAHADGDALLRLRLDAGDHGRLERPLSRRRARHGRAGARPRGDRHGDRADCRRQRLWAARSPLQHAQGRGDRRRRAHPGALPRAGVHPRAGRLARRHPCWSRCASSPPIRYRSWRMAGRCIRPISSAVA